MVYFENMDSIRDMLNELSFMMYDYENNHIDDMKARDNINIAIDYINQQIDEYGQGKYNHIATY